MNFKSALPKSMCIALCLSGAFAVPSKAKPRVSAANAVLGKMLRANLRDELGPSFKMLSPAFSATLEEQLYSITKSGEFDRLTSDEKFEVALIFFAQIKKWEGGPIVLFRDMVGKSGPAVAGRILKITDRELSLGFRLSEAEVKKIKEVVSDLWK